MDYHGIVVADVIGIAACVTHYHRYRTWSATDGSLSTRAGDDLGNRDPDITNNKIRRRDELAAQAFDKPRFASGYKYQPLIASVSFDPSVEFATRSFGAAEECAIEVGR